MVPTVCGELPEMLFLWKKYSIPYCPLLQDLLPGHVLILSGVPYFSARAAVMHLELEWPSPWAQVRPFLFLILLILRVEDRGQEPQARLPGWTWSCFELASDPKQGWAACRVHRSHPGPLLGEIKLSLALLPMSICLLGPFLDVDIFPVCR